MTMQMHRLALSKKPQGQATRGKTASNRLRRVDNFLLLYDPALLLRTEGLFARSLFVDLGFGADARTTLESAARFRNANPSLPILGVEINPERVRAAQPYADENTHFRLGGFNLPLKEGETVRLIRAFNVLRQYDETDFAPAYETLSNYVLPGGLMIEGTSTPFGQVWAANVVRRMGDGTWEMEALVFSTNFHTGFDVEEFQTILPKNLIHHVVPGQPIHAFFEDWKRAAAETSALKIYGPRQWFTAAAERLAAHGYPVETQRKWLMKGYLIWKSEKNKHTSLSLSAGSVHEGH
jgi:hypothetical protein